MKIEVISVSTSKKGNRFLQAKIIEGEDPKAGDVLECGSPDTSTEEALAELVQDGSAKIVGERDGEKLYALTPAGIKEAEDLIAKSLK